MILTCHILLGALIGEKIKIVPLVIIVAFISHYLLDLIPHTDYQIENIKQRKWKKSFPDLLKVILDIFFGFWLVLIFSGKQPVIFIGALAAVLSDGLNFVNFIFPNKILRFHANLHRKIHFPKDPAPEPRTRTSTVRDKQARYGADKKIPLFWRIFSQVLIIIIVIALLWLF